jgi:hypothetical protein
LDFFLDFEELCFFLEAVDEEEEDCDAPGRPAPETTGDALARSAAPKMSSKVRLVIIYVSRSITARVLE